MSDDVARLALRMTSMNILDLETLRKAITEIGVEEVSELLWKGDKEELRKRLIEWQREGRKMRERVKRYLRIQQRIRGLPEGKR